MKGEDFLTHVMQLSFTGRFSGYSDIKTRICSRNAYLYFMLILKPIKKEEVIISVCRAYGQTEGRRNWWERGGRKERKNEPSGREWCKEGESANERRRLG